MKQIKRVRILIFLIFLSLVIFQTRSFSEAENSSVGLSNLHKIVSILLVLGLSIHYLLTFGYRRIKNKALALYGIYLFVGILSTLLYSNWIGYSLWKLAELFSVFFSVLFIYELSKINFFYYQYAFNILLKYYKYFILLTIFGIVIFPSLAIRPPSQFQDAFLPYMLHGSIAKINSNSLGMMAAIIFFTNTVDYFNSKNKKSIIIWLIISFLILIFAQSRTALASLIVILIGYLFFTKKLSNLGKVVIVIASAGLFYLNINSILKYVGRGYSIEHLDKLSGRIEWWTSAWDTFIEASPMEQMIGLGFGVANRTILSDLDFEEAASLHSEYVDASKWGTN